MQTPESKSQILTPGHLEELLSHLEACLWQKQAVDGHWHYPLDDSVTMNAEYIFFLFWMNLDEKDLIQRLANFLLQQQNEDGSWSLYYGGSPHLSSSVEAYLALRLAGFSKEDPRMLKAAQAIRSEGGPPRSRVFTKIWLALFELHPWDGVPMIPPEILLNPKGSPFHILEFSYWSRSVIIPLTILFHIKKTYGVNFDLSELYPSKDSEQDLGYAPVIPVDESWIHKSYQQSLQWIKWDSLFFGLNRAFNFYETGLTVKPFRQLAVQKAKTWILEHQDESGDWGGIMPAIMNSLMALRALGEELDSAPIAKGLQALKRLCRGESDSIRSHAHESEETVCLQSCVSPVWDTALATLALLESGVKPTDPRLQRAKSWLWSQRITRKGDWIHKSLISPHEPTAAWCFQYHNDFFPDLDDTALVIFVLHRLGMGLEELEPALRFVFGMQNRDGGWGTFDRENTQWILNEIPFADLRSLIDPSNPDVTGHLLEALGGLGLSDRREVRAAVKYLKSCQRPGGSWYGRWGVNLLYGTCAATVGLRAVGEAQDSECLQRAAEFVLKQQNPDGGWGEDCDNYLPETQRAEGKSTPSQTAWALMSLEACGFQDRERKEAVDRGIEFLKSRQIEDGLLEPEFTGTGFPRHFYLRYDGYRLYFPLIALGRIQSSSNSSSS